MNYLVDLGAQGSWENFVRAMLHTLWQGSIIAGLLWIGLRAIPARFARCRYVIATSGLGLILLAGMLTWAVLDRGGMAAIVGHRAGVPAPVAKTFGAMSEKSAPGPASHIQANSRHLPWTTLAGWLWTCGAMLMLVRTAVGTARAGRLAAGGEVLRGGPVRDRVEEMKHRLGIHRPVAVVIFDRWIVPAVTGFFWPALLLPACALTEWPADQLQMVLAHELAHIRRWDYLVNLLQQVVEAVLFFNPAVWWVSHQMRIEREACCDAAAARVAGAAVETAGALAAIAQRLTLVRVSPTAAMAIAAGESGSLLDRVRRLLRPEERPRVAGPWYATGVAIAAALLGLGVLRAGAEVAVSTTQRLLTPAEQIAKIAEIQKAQEPTYAAGQMVEATGTVRTADGSALPRGSYLSILAQNGSNSTADGVNPDGRGRFRENVQAGLTAYVIAVDGFAPAYAGPVEPDAHGRLPAIEIVLKRGFTASVRVTDPDGKPVKGAKVDSVYTQNCYVGGQSHVTGGDGMIALSHSTSAAPILLDVTCPGYEFQSQTVTLTPTAPVEFRLTPAQPTTGQVVDALTGAPIPGAAIRLVRREGYGDAIHCPWDYGFYKTMPLSVTDESGRFSLESLRADSECVVWVSAAGHGGEFMYGVRAGQKNLVWKLGPERIVRGRITGDLSQIETRNNGRSSYEIWYEPQVRFSNQVYSVEEDVKVIVADGVGRFELRDAMPGEIVLSVGEETTRLDPSTLPALVELHIGSKDKLVVNRHVILKFDLPPGSPAPQGKLRLFYLDPQGPTYEPVDLPLRNGVAEYDATVPGKIGYSTDGLIGCWIEEKQDIDVPPGPDPFVVTIPAIPAGAIHGRVLESDGSPYRSHFAIGTVEITKSPDLGQRFAPIDIFNGNDGSGNFLITPIPLGGRYRFVAWDNDQFAVSDELPLDAEDALRDVTLRFAEGIPIRVFVKDADGHPRSGVKVSVMFQVTQTTGSFGGLYRPTGSDGIVSFEQVNPNIGGQYSLAVEAGIDFPQMTVPFIPGGKTVEVTLARGLSLKGQVINDATGAPMAHVMIRYYGDASPNDAVWTDDKGRFEFRNLENSRRYSLGVDNMRSVATETYAPGQDITLHVKPMASQP